MRDGKEPSVVDSYPLVTVITVTYPTPENGRIDMLKRAFASIERQASTGFTDFEVFVVDDGSPLQSTVFEMCQEWGTHMFDTYGINVGFKPFTKNTGGQGGGFNWAMVMSQASYVAYHDDDIEWDDNFLATMVSAISKPGIDLVYSRWRVDLSEPVTEPSFHWRKDENGMAVFPSRPYTRGALTEGGPTRNFIDGNFVLHSKCAAVVQCLWPTGRLWDDTVHRFNDWEFLSRWERQGCRITFVDEVLGQPHFHGDNRTTQVNKRDLISSKYARGIEAWRDVRHSCSDLVTAITLH